MTITVTSTFTRAAGNGVTTVFNFPFKIFTATDLVVRDILDSTGTPTTKTNVTDYTVAISATGEGGTVTMVTAPASGHTLDIRSNIPVTQGEDIRNQGRFLPEIHEGVFDKLARLIQDARRLISLSVQAPDYEGSPPNLTLPNAVQRALNYLAFDVNGNVVVSSGTGGGDASLRNDLANTTTAGKGNDLVSIRRTAAEIAVAVTPISYAYPELHVCRYGAARNNSTDDYNAINNAILVANARGGGTVFGFEGNICKVTLPLTVLDRVDVNLEGGTINSNLSGINDSGFKLRNYSKLRNGIVNVISSGSPGSQAGIHAPVLIGPLYGNGGTVGSLSPDEGVTGWVLQNLKLSTNRDGKGCISIMGGANNGLIENIEAPDSSHIGGVIFMDWGTIGSIVSADVPTSRTNFNAGTAYTTHPNNIIVRNIKVGTQTYSAAGVGFAIRLSGVHGITVENVDVAAVTYAGFFHTAGDLGYEFAPVAIKPYAHRGIVVRNFNVRNANNGWGYFNDNYADNVDVAIGGGYVALLDPFCESDITFENCYTSSNAGASTLPGFRIQNGRGCNLIDCQASGHLWGVLVETAGHRTNIVRGRYSKNRNDGIYVNGSTKPLDVIIEEVFCDQNGQDAGYGNASGIKIDSAIRTKVIRCKLGADGSVTEATQKLGINIASTNAVLVSLRDNYVNAVKAATGIAYGISASTDYTVLDVFEGNRAASGVASFFSGVNILPTGVEYDTAGNEIRKFRGARGALTASITPTAGAWKVGDVIFYSDPIASDFAGSLCVTAGSPGTWKRFGATTA